MSLVGKTALVTGGGRGIGRAIAERLAAAGAKVVVCGRTAADLEAVAEAISGEVRVVDLLDREATARLADEVLSRHGRIDVLVSNAGIAESAALSATTDDVFDRTMALNVTAPFVLTRALVPAMVAAGWGRVVNIASNAGLVGYAYTSAYCASKHALVGLTRALAVELATTGVTVNAICPGFVDTELTAAAVRRIQGKTGRSEDDARRALAAMSPQKRLMTADEIAHAVMSLVPHEARGITGQSLAIDGGQTQ